MKVEFINPFITALINVLATMAQMTVVIGKPSHKKDDIAEGDVSGLISMVSIQVEGSLSISFEERLICQIMQNMLGEKPDVIDSEVKDLVGELTNMICGGAKKELSEKGFDFGMATPIVVSGKNHIIDHKVVGSKMVLPFSSDAGNLYLEMCFNK